MQGPYVQQKQTTLCKNEVKITIARLAELLDAPLMLVALAGTSCVVFAHRQCQAEISVGLDPVDLLVCSRTRVPKCYSAIGHGRRLLCAKSRTQC